MVGLFNTEGEPTTAQHREWGKKRSAHPGRKRCMGKLCAPLGPQQRASPLELGMKRPRGEPRAQLPVIRQRRRVLPAPSRQSYHQVGPTG